jgi:hypothetical protein
MNKDLLLDIFRIPSQSGKEDKMRDFIKKYLKKNNISFSEDKKGNIFQISNKAPLLSAHMDTVQDFYDTQLTKFIKIRGDILSGYGVIGGDDKCGIYLILRMLTCSDVKINFLFSVEEETGAGGATDFVRLQEPFLNNILYGIILDRCGNNDIICTDNEYGIYEFEKVLLEIGKLYGYKKGRGTFSDANVLSKYFSCANLSVGYYNAHSKNEFVNLSDLSNAEKFVHSIIKNINYNFEKPEKFNYYDRYTYYNDCYYSEYYDEYDEYDEYNEDSCIFCKKKTKLIYLPSFDRYSCVSCGVKFIDDFQLNYDNFNKNSEEDLYEDFLNSIELEDY